MIVVVSQENMIVAMERIFTLKAEQFLIGVSTADEIQVRLY